MAESIHSWSSDEIAQRTNWAPQGRALSELANVRIVHRETRRIELRNPSVVLFAGAGLLLIGTTLTVRGFGGTVQIIPTLALLLGVAVTAAGLTPTGIFDRQTGQHWRPPRFPGRATLLADVYALQVLEVNRLADSGARQDYEINLVRRDASRVTCTVQRGYEHTRLLAEEIAGFLEVPLWDPAE